MEDHRQTHQPVAMGMNYMHMYENAHRRRQDREPKHGYPVDSDASWLPQGPLGMTYWAQVHP